MATPAIEVPANVVERNLGLTEKIMRFLLDNPHVFRSLPDNFELVILPDDDPEIRSYNLELLDRYGSEGKPIVFARTKTQLVDPAQPPAPTIFIPIPVTA